MPIPEKLIEELKANTPKRGHSVQARAEDNTLFDTPGAGYSQFIFPIAATADNFPAWSYYPTIRDARLRIFYKTEPKLKGAVYSMTAFGKSLDLQIDGLPRAKKYSQLVVQDCENGMGQRSLVGKSLLDFYTQDNGMFWELVGAGRADRPLRGQLLPPYVMHLDSARCWRTFDEEFPVVYQNPINGTFHKLHYTRVIYSANMEQPDELARGIGFCPVSRVLEEAQYARDLLTFRREKVSGSFNRAIGYGVGINAQVFKDSLQAANGASTDEGFTVYKGIPFILRAQGAMELKLLDLAGVPDGFNLETETALYMYIVALAFGVDAREFWPATASGATKADASIQDQKTQGKGKGDVIETLENMWRQVFPDTVEAQYDYTDDEQDLQKANIWKIHSETFLAGKTSGTLDAEEARAHLVKEGVYDAALLKATTPEQANAEPVDDSTPVEDEATETTSSGGKPDIAGQEKKPAVEDEVEAKEFLVLDVKKKELSSTRSNFETAFYNILTGSRDGDYTRAQAQRLLYRLIQRYGTRGYVDGMNDGGVEIDESELEREDTRTINRLLSGQGAYVSDFMATVFDGDVSDLVAEGKPEQWFNGSIMPFYYAGLQASGDDPMMEFVGEMGKETCDDCPRLFGQRHRLSRWIEKGFNPPNGINLQCSPGLHCRHTLIRVRGRERGGW